jgi:hypothetical protein
MVRKVFGTFAVALLLCASVVMADEVKGKITKVDPDKKVITVSMDGKDTDYTVADDCKLPPPRMRGGKGGGGGGGDAKPMTLKELQTAVDRAKDRGGYAATVTVEKKGGKEQVTEIKAERGGRPGTDKPKDKDK